MKLIAQTKQLAIREEGGMFLIPGDRVKLKSGGPLMTVDRVLDKEGYQMAECLWFSTNTVLPFRCLFCMTSLSLQTEPKDKYWKTS